jgi:excisionase family DNA binding protein
LSAESEKETPKLAYGINELSEATGFGRSTIYEQIAAGALRARKLGARTFIEADDVKAWLRNLPEKAA